MLDHLQCFHQPLIISKGVTLITLGQYLSIVDNRSEGTTPLQQAGADEQQIYKSHSSISWCSVMIFVVLCCGYVENVMNRRNEIVIFGLCTSTVQEHVLC